MAQLGTAAGQRKKKKNMRRYQLLLMALPLMLLVVLFAYVPLFGWSYAFFDYKPGLQLWECELRAFYYFKQFLTRPVGYAAGNEKSP